jgi:ElaB/YqjD/DUF883 family membrane-anchored ribosome-binding protein
MEDPAMENLYSPATADQARKTAKDAERLGADVKRDFDGAVSRGKDAADEAREAARDAAGSMSGRAREVAGAARRNIGKAAGKVSDYADANTAIVAVAAFGVGILVGHLVTRES